MLGVTPRRARARCRVRHRYVDPSRSWTSPTTVIGADRSPEMLAQRGRCAWTRTSCGPPPNSCRSPTASFDAVTVCSGVHWFDQARFFAEVRRLLRPGGWVALYDHYFIGEMVDVPEFASGRASRSTRYPLPPRNDRRSATRPPKRPMASRRSATSSSTDDIDMTHEQLVDYELSISNLVAAEARANPREDLRAWMTETTAPSSTTASERAPCASSAPSSASGRS